MEALLQEALDEFDDDDESAPAPSEPPAPAPASAPAATAATAATAAAPPPPATAPVPAPSSASSSKATAPPKPAPDVSSETLDREADELARQLMEGLSLGGGGGGGADSMEETLRALARSAETVAQDHPDGAGADPMELLKQLGLGGGEAGGSGGGDAAMDGLLDNLVGQLLSKEVMLEPMQHLQKELPKYMEEKGDSLSAADKQRFQRQHDIIGQILAAYEEKPNDPDKIATLMQEMQACGPPPTEIAGAPGLDALNGCVIS